MNPSELHPDDLIGATHLHSHWRIFAGTVAEWILDYELYDPGFEKSDGIHRFRGGLLVVSEQNANEFHAAMSEYELTAEDLRLFVRDVGPRDWPLSIIIDFDARQMVSAFDEVPVCEYLPPGWRGLYGDPLSFAPESVRRIWV